MKSEDNGDRLAAALVENDRLRSENERLRKLLRVRELCPQIISASEMETLSSETPPLAADEKIRLFRSLFRGREDIYAVRWEGKSGKAGYSPAHIRRGWFGNLIALPLQRGPRNEGNSVFLWDDFCPIPDQWSFLSLAKRLSIEKMHEVVREAERTGNLIGIRLSACDEEESDPWLMPPSPKKKPEVIPGPLSDRVAVTLGNLVYVPKDGLPSAMLNQLLRLAAFQNPENRLWKNGGGRMDDCSSKNKHACSGAPAAAARSMA